MNGNEENLPAELTQKGEDPRISRPNEDDRRPERPEEETNSRPPSPRRLDGLSRSRFDEVFQKGRRTNGEFVRLIVLPAAEPGRGRLGLAASKSIGCHARRNRVRRRLKEAFWLSGGLPDFDAVLVGKEKSRDSEFAPLLSEIERILLSVGPG